MPRLWQSQKRDNDVALWPLHLSVVPKYLLHHEPPQVFDPLWSLQTWDQCPSPLTIEANRKHKWNSHECLTVPWTRFLLLLESYCQPTRRSKVYTQASFTQYQLQSSWKRRGLNFRRESRLRRPDLHALKTALNWQVLMTQNGKQIFYCIIWLLFPVKDYI